MKIRAWKMGTKVWISGCQTPGIDLAGMLGCVGRRGCAVGWSHRIATESLFPGCLQLFFHRENCRVFQAWKISDIRARSIF